MLRGVAAEYALQVEQGADLSENFAFTVGAARLDFTGWTLHCHLRPHVDSPELVDLSGHLDAVTDVEIDGGDPGPGLRLHVPGTVTATLTGPMVYDVLAIAPGGSRRFLLHGQVTVRRAVTHV
jgi:hypothetical protein